MLAELVSYLRIMKRPIFYNNQVIDERLHTKLHMIFL